MDRDEKKPVILIVDDVPKNLEVLGIILKREDYRISVASGGEQALAIVKEIVPDLILLDIMMPDIDGYEVCKTLKASLLTRDIPIIFLTAKTESQDIVNGFQVGAVDYIAKPFNSAELLARVHTHLELKAVKDNQQKLIAGQKQLIAKLEDALGQVKQLSGFIPICSHCKKIRNDEGFWQQVEEYVASHTEAQFSHGICPECLRRLYPQVAERITRKENPKP
ncbi:MAG: response regulator [Deltaproteobacteria bacterium]|nr:response regulator [Deltaproteobacteria bacterium]MBF0526047.1 response regulator [Deltaproteobacteria bacterium]